MSILDNINIQVNRLDKQVILDYAYNNFPIYKEGGYDMFGRKLNKGDYVIFYPQKSGTTILKFGIIKKVTKTGATITSRNLDYIYDNENIYSGFTIVGVDIKNTLDNASIIGSRIFKIGNELQFLNFINSLGYEHIG